MGLNELQTGRKAKINHIDTSNVDSSRLYELGFLPGEELEVVSRAPLGGPMIVRLMGYKLCLRRDSAACIHIEPQESAQSA